MQLTFKKIISGIVIGFALTSCTASETSETAEAKPTIVDQKILTECALLNEAMIRSAVTTGSQNTQIVRGCPGYENIPNSTNRSTEAGQFVSASSAEVPNAALSKGKMGKILFQRMIARGVPVNIATEMVSTPQFDQAVSAYN